jgi:hypothetical protein
MSAVSIKSDKGDDYQWTYKGSAKAKVLKLRQYDQNGGYQGTAD